MRGISGSRLIAPQVRRGPMHRGGRERWGFLSRNSAGWGLKLKGKSIISKSIRLNVHPCLSTCASLKGCGGVWRGLDPHGYARKYVVYWNPVRGTSKQFKMCYGDLMQFFGVYWLWTHGRSVDIIKLLESLFTMVIYAHTSSQGEGNGTARLQVQERLLIENNGLDHPFRAPHI